MNTNILDQINECTIKITNVREKVEINKKLWPNRVRRIDAVVVFSTADRKVLGSNP